MSPRRLAAVAGSLVLCASGCALPGGDRSAAEPAGAETTTAAPSPAAASARLRQFRRDLTRRVLQVTVTTREPLRVTGAELAVPGFDPVPATAVDVALEAGATVDLPVAYGAARCSDAPGSAVAVLTTPAGRVRLALDDGGLVARLHKAQCAEQELARAVGLSVGASWVESERDGRPVLRGTLVVTRRERGRRVVVTGLGAHIVLTVRPADPADLPLVLGPGDAEVQLGIDLVASRCDPHALAENKRMGLLGAYVALGEGEPRLVTVTPDDGSQARLVDFAVRACRS
jgi:hypothetical protein